MNYNDSIRFKSLVYEVSSTREMEFRTTQNINNTTITNIISGIYYTKEPGHTAFGNRNELGKIHLF